MEEMLRRRRLAAGLEPSFTELAIERTDGLDVNGMLAEELRQWYAGLLAGGDRSFLAVDSIAPAAAVVLTDPPAGGIRIALPENCRRVFDIRLRHWNRPATVEKAEELDRAYRRQLNSYTAATPDNPVAVSDGNHIYAWPAAAGTTIASLSGVNDPGEGVFEFDDTALSLMPRGPVPDYGLNKF